MKKERYVTEIGCHTESGLHKLKHYFTSIFLQVTWEIGVHCFVSGREDAVMIIYHL